MGQSEPGTAGVFDAGRGLLAGMRFQHLQGYDLKCLFVSGCKIDLGGAALVSGLHEPARAKAPLIARDQTGKIELWAWGAQVVANIGRVGKELSRHDRTDRMAAMIFGAGVAVTVAKEPGERIVRARLKRATENIEAWIFAYHAAVPPLLALQSLRNFSEHCNVRIAHATLLKLPIRSR